MYNPKRDALTDFLQTRGVGTIAEEDPWGVRDREHQAAVAAQGEKLATWNRYIRQFTPDNDAPLDIARLKELRLRAGLSTAEVGAMTGLSAAMVEQAERGIGVGPFVRPLKAFAAGVESLVADQGQEHA